MGGDTTPDVTGDVVRGDMAVIGSNTLIGINSPLTPQIQPITVGSVPARAVCSCVMAVQYWGLAVRGNAIDILPNTEDPEIGGGILFYSDNPYGHIALITYIKDDIITVSEANYFSCEEGTREVEITDKLIRGYVKKT